MEILKIDRNKLYSIPDYAKLMGVERQTIYNWLKDDEKKKEIKLIEISGKKFIQI
jgi:predicted DNA-binding transcriptional regulator AlpA